MKYKLYWGTEENCFECEKLGEFNTFQEGKNCILDNLKHDVSSDELNIIGGEINEEKEVYCYMNEHEYEYVFVLTTNGRSGRKVISEMRKDALTNF